MGIVRRKERIGWNNEEGKISSERHDIEIAHYLYLPRKAQGLYKILKKRGNSECVRSNMASSSSSSSRA